MGQLASSEGGSADKPFKKTESVFVLGTVLLNCIPGVLFLLHVLFLCTIRIYRERKEHRVTTAGAHISKRLSSRDCLHTTRQVQKFRAFFRKGFVWEAKTLGTKIILQNAAFFLRFFPKKALLLLSTSLAENFYWAEQTIDEKEEIFSFFCRCTKS